MDRVIAYDGALPQTTDVLNAGKFALVGQAYQDLAILGASTVVAGLGCTATSPTADLHVTVNVGSIYQMDPTDASAYGDLGTDSNNIMKQGLLQSPVQLTITPPATAGYSQVYLVQAILNDVDAGQMVLSYYNSADEEHPFSGPANSGTSNYTIRSCQCVVALKAGTPASTGTQAAPTPDAGYVGLYTITVANGQTQITSTSISQLASAPFFPTLPSVPSNVLNGSWVYAGQDTGAANAYVITFQPGQPIPAAYVTGMGIKFKALNANTLASTVNVNGLGPVSIRRASGVALSANDINSGQVVELTYDGTYFQMQNYLGAGATSNTNTVVGIPYVADTGAQNAIVATFSPAITSAQQIPGLTVEVKLAYTITGACTINVNGLGVKNVTTGDLANPPNSVFVAGEVLLLIYDGTQYQIANTSSQTFRKPSANFTIYVNTAIGNDANDGVSNTSGHALKTITGGINLAFSYAPSQYTITIVVEPGQYNEQVIWPSWAGPNIIVDGLNAASVTVNAANSGYCFYVQGPNTATIKNLTVQNSGGLTASCFIATSGATVYTQNTASYSAVAVFAAAAGGTIWPGTHTFSGSATVLYYALNSGTINLNVYTHTFSTAISVSWATAVAQANGSIIVNSGQPIMFANPGFVSGAKFAALLNGVVNTNGSGVNYFPGSVGGGLSTGGQYG